MEKLKFKYFVLSFLILASLCFFSCDSANAFLNFKEKNIVTIFLNDKNPLLTANPDELIQSRKIFRTNERIYFYVYSQKPFKSDYLKYQIVKQEDNAHIGGYSRLQNKTVRLKDKNSYLDYFIINKSGKYFIQIFDITNLNQWIAFDEFRVVDE